MLFLNSHRTLQRKRATLSCLKILSTLQSWRWWSVKFQSATVTNAVECYQQLLTASLGLRPVPVIGSADQRMITVLCLQAFLRRSSLLHLAWGRQAVETEKMCIAGLMECQQNQMSLTLYQSIIQSKSFRWPK